MRLKYLYTILLLCCVNICFAQNKLFDKYADMDDVTSVYISKKMFQMMPVMETAGLNLANLKGKIESLQILTTQKADLRERMRGEFKALIGKDHEELMRVKDGKTKANFYVKQQGELIQELIMIADMDDGGFSVMQLLGRFTLQDVQEITSEINKKSYAYEKIHFYRDNHPVCNGWMWRRPFIDRWSYNRGCKR